MLLLEVQLGYRLLLIIEVHYAYLGNLIIGKDKDTTQIYIMLANNFLVMALNLLSALLQYLSSFTLSTKAMG